MSDAPDLLCEIFVDTILARSHLLRLLGELASGSINDSTISSDWAKIQVRRNPDRDEVRKNDKREGFLFYPYSVEVDPADFVTREQYVSGVAVLLDGLWKAGCPAVAACDFEDELPRGGGIRNS
jgi:hypothetical protein